jgi:hypothetical protein
MASSMTRSQRQPRSFVVSARLDGVRAQIDPIFPTMSRYHRVSTSEAPS